MNYKSRIIFVETIILFMYLQILGAIFVLFLGYIIFGRAYPMMEFKNYYSK